MRFVGIDCAVVVLMGACLCTGQAKPAKPSAGTAKIEFSNCQAAQIASPDGKWLLTARFALGACPPTAPNVAELLKHDAPDAHGNSWGIELFLEDTITHTRHTIPFEGYDGEAGWSPSGKAFFVNDHSASNVTESSLYFTDSLRKIDAGDAILHADPGAARYFDSHIYFQTRRWLDGHTALVQLCGHTDSYPSRQFDFRYRMDLGGHVQRLAKHVWPATTNHAECGD
jgi:hypothetical protein